MKHIALLACAFAGYSAFAIGPFALPWMNHPTAGTTFYSLDYPDGIFVIEAYYRTCSYCNKNAPNVDRLADDYRNETRVRIMDVGLDAQDNEYKIWIDTHRPNHPVLKDGKKQVLGPLGTKGYPSTYVLDCNGTVVFQSEGEWDSKVEQGIRAAIDQLNSQICYPMVVR